MSYRPLTARDTTSLAANERPARQGRAFVVPATSGDQYVQVGPRSLSRSRPLCSVMSGCAHQLQPDVLPQPSHR